MPFYHEMCLPFVRKNKKKKEWVIEKEKNPSILPLASMMVSS